MISPHVHHDSPTVLKITPTVLMIPPRYSRYPSIFIMISPTVLNTPTVLKMSPHGTHDIPHVTEHPHGTAHTLYRVVLARSGLEDKMSFKKSVVNRSALEEHGSAQSYVGTQKGLFVATYDYFFAGLDKDFFAKWLPRIFLHFLK